MGLLLYDALKPSFDAERKRKKDAEKKMLKYFNPIIEQGFWGTKIKWVGREKPLTDEELEKLM